MIGSGRGEGGRGIYRGACKGSPHAPFILLHTTSVRLLGHLHLFAIRVQGWGHVSRAAARNRQHCLGFDPVRGDCTVLSVIAVSRYDNSAVCYSRYQMRQQCCLLQPFAEMATELSVIGVSRAGNSTVCYSR